jgi:hypothetical protein
MMYTRAERRLFAVLLPLAGGLAGRAVANPSVGIAIRVPQLGSQAAVMVSSTAVVRKSTRLARNEPVRATAVSCRALQTPLRRTPAPALTITRERVARSIELIYPPRRG